MEDLLAVDEVKPVQQLLHHFLDLAEVELDVGVAEQASQVMLSKVKDQVKGGPVPNISDVRGTFHQNILFYITFGSETKASTFTEPGGFLQLETLETSCYC